jgi:transglutaminase-like putative cysteine protease
MFLRNVGLRITLFIMAAVVAGLLRARADDWPPVTPEELKMTGEPLAPGAPAVILYRQVDHRDGDVHRPYETSYYRVKILTEEGRRYADVDIPYIKGQENIYGIEARTIHPDGSIVKFDGKTYDKTIEKTKGVRYLAKTFTIPDVQVGSIIEYRYGKDWDQFQLYNSRWIVSEDLFTKRARFSMWPFTEEMYTCHWVWQGLPTGSDTPKLDGKGVVRLELQNIAAVQQDDYAPPANALKAHVDFIYSEDSIETNPDKFWKREGKHLFSRVDGYINKRNAMEQAVAGIVAAGDSPEAKLRKIYARVQQLRNLSYEREQTAQEPKQQDRKDNTPDVIWDAAPWEEFSSQMRSKHDYLTDSSKLVGNVENTWKRGYGDEKELTWLFLGLARAAGFEAWPVMVAARSEYIFNSKVLNAQQLNEAVVLVKLNGQDMFFDPGTKFVPYGLLPWSETGVTGLRLDKDGGTWVQTSIPLSSASRVVRKADLKLDDVGTLEGKLTVTYSGLEASWRRREVPREDAAARKKFLEDDVKGWVPAASEVKLKNAPDWDSSAETFVVEFDLKVPTWAAGTGQRALLPVGLFSGAEKHVFEHADRGQDVSFQFPYEKTDDITIELPLGWRVDSLPPAQDIDSAFCGYALQVESQNGALHLTRRFAMHGIWLDRQYYGPLRVFFQAVRTEDNLQIVLLPGPAAARH